LAFSVTLSSIVALTLCPMLASRMLTAHAIEHHSGPLARFGDAFSSFYRRSLSACLNAPIVVVAVCVAFSLVAFAAFSLITSELTPREDRSR
jgi:HAE1 family hydrophobic/amphiphilic exporter-1